MIDIQKPQETTSAVRQAAANTELGKLLAEHKASSGAGQVVGGLFIVLIGIFEMVLAGQMSDGGGPLVLLGVLFLIGGIIVMVLPATYQSHAAYCYEHGFVYTEGGPLQVFRWDKIPAVWIRIVRNYRNGVYVGTTYRYTIRRADGHEIVLSNKLDQIEKLGNLVEKKVTDYLLPKYIASYIKGNSLPFGVLNISQEGISNGVERVSWGQLKEIDVHQGVIRVKKDGKFFSWSSATVASIPNFTVFMTLVRAVQAGKLPTIA